MHRIYLNDDGDKLPEATPDTNSRLYRITKVQKQANTNGNQGNTKLLSLTLECDGVLNDLFDGLDKYLFTGQINLTVDATFFYSHLVRCLSVYCY